jgi:hypothetical protein
MRCAEAVLSQAILITNVAATTPASVAFIGDQCTATPVHMMSHVLTMGLI